MIISSLKFSPPVIAHRGASREAPENTMSAFIKAYELGSNWIECDVMLTADQQLIIFHDDSLKRTTNGEGKVTRHLLNDIKMLDAGSWFDSKFSNERVPDLKELLQFIHQKKKFANIEIKAEQGKELIIAKNIDHEINKEFTDLVPQLLFSSFSITALQCLRDCSRDFMLGLLLDEWRSDWFKICHALNCISVHLDYHLITPDRAKQIKTEGKLLLAYTVNNVDEARRLFDLGVDAVFSDVPNLLLKHFP